MPVLEYKDIAKILPHRYPFLLIDRVLEFVPYDSLVAIKNVTINEPFFVGHFPDQPVMPGVLIIEAMAQAMAILGFKSLESKGVHLTGRELVYFGGIDNARFKRPVVPGDQLRFEVKLGKFKSGVCKSEITVTVQGEFVCSAELMAAFRSPNS
ncbi:MAG: 3-hydroxyacyl-[acyl-carrier-protein] dehydratase FabZ [Gammaproteobacteria bacterium]|nr:3-hydroxyacyl-[acyl-carrier-protein] dehydratase FabZ [Gammaproteobacteria bacterium]